MADWLFTMMVELRSGVQGVLEPEMDALGAMVAVLFCVTSLLDDLARVPWFEDELFWTMLPCSFMERIVLRF